MIATKKSDLRIITYVVFVHKDDVESTLDGYTHVDEKNENPLKNMKVTTPSAMAWEDYMTFTLQDTNEEKP